jgi:hypothetical protein
MRRFSLAVFLLCMLASSYPAQKDSPDPGVNYENYQRLKIGMKYAEVVEILGKEGEELGRKTVPKGMVGHNTLIVYKWAAEKKDSYVAAEFENGKLREKRQKGLDSQKHHASPIIQ